MSFVPGYDYDMFISYAHLDDQPPASGLPGWVNILVKKLEAEVRQRGIKNFAAWFDRNLAENLPLTPQLKDKINRSAILLVVMSPSYLQSDWCRREREAFLSLVRNRVAEGCVFVVETREVHPSSYPSEFGDLVPVKFWVLDQDSDTDRPLGVPSPDEEKYYKRLLKLSHLVKNQLDLLAKKQTFHPATLDVHAAPAAETVFIARTTEDLEDREDELRTYLNQFGIAVLPQTQYPQTDAAAFEAAMLKDLNSSKLYVQLLSATRGRELNFFPRRRHPCFQHDLAEKSQKTRLLWRERSLDLTSVDDPDHRRLLESARACAIEDFKRAVVDELRKKPPPALSRAGANIMVFVNADRRDRDLAQQIGAELMKRGVECFYPLESGTPEEIRRDLEDTLRDCDGMLLIYGSAGTDWIRYQLRQSSKARARRDPDRPLKALAVFEGPPPDKGSIGADIPSLITLDCRKGIDLSLLKQFADSLQG